MLNGMSHSRHILIIGKVPDVNIETSAGFVGLGIVYKKSFELIWQSNDAVGSIVKIWLFESISDSIYATHDCCVASFGKMRSFRRMVRVAVED